MLRILEHGAAGTDLDNLSEVHHRYAVADPFDHRHVVGNEQVGQAERILQIEHQVDDLGSYRDVERRDGLVGDDDPGPQRQRARQCDPLPLAAGELVRIALCMGLRKADVLEQRSDALFGGARPMPRRECTAARRPKIPPSDADRATRTGPGTPSGYRAAADGTDRATAARSRDRRARCCRLRCRLGVAASGRSSTCRSRIRRPGPASRPHRGRS